MANTVLTFLETNQRKVGLLTSKVIDDLELDEQSFPCPFLSLPYKIRESKALVFRGQ